MSPCDVAAHQAPLARVPSRMYAPLEQSGRLDESLDQAANQTSEALVELLHQSVPCEEACLPSSCRSSRRG